MPGSGAAVERAAVMGAVYAVMHAAHQVADHWVQTDHQAAHKGLPGRVGRVACAAHVAGYTAANAAAVVAMHRALGLPVSWRAVLAGQAVSALTHYWADRRTPLRWLAERVGRGRLYALGAPRPGTDDQPHLGTGAYALDQSWHIGWIAVGALVTALLSGRRRGRA